MKISNLKIGCFAGNKFFTYFFFIGNGNCRNLRSCMKKSLFITVNDCLFLNEKSQAYDHSSLRKTIFKTMDR